MVSLNLHSFRASVLAFTVVSALRTSWHSQVVPPTAQHYLLLIEAGLWLNRRRFYFILATVPSRYGWRRKPWTHLPWLRSPKSSLHESGGETERCSVTTTGSRHGDRGAPNSIQDHYCFYRIYPSGKGTFPSQELSHCSSDASSPIRVYPSHTPKKQPLTSTYYTIT